MLRRNDELWQGGRCEPSTGSPLRSYEFWHDYYCLDYRDDHGVSAYSGGWLREIWSLELKVFSGESESGNTEFGTLRFSASPEYSSLELSWMEVLPSGYAHDKHVLAYWDRAHQQPYLFRWSEMQALVSFLEDGDRPMTPSSPSLAMLLLAPFTAITEDDDIARCEGLVGSELEGLGFFEPDELLIAPQLTSMGPETYWERNAEVGWNLHWDREYRPMSRVPYSLRTDKSPDFPARNFKRLLQAVGVDDLD